MPQTVQTNNKRCIKFGVPTLFDSILGAPNPFANSLDLSSSIAINNPIVAAPSPIEEVDVIVAAPSPNNNDDDEAPPTNNDEEVDVIVAAPSPDMEIESSANCNRYEKPKKLFLPRKKNQLIDSLPQESNHHVSFPSKSVQLTGNFAENNNNLANFFKKVPRPMKNENLIHGNILNSNSESVEPQNSESIQSSDDEMNNFQYLPPSHNNNNYKPSVSIGPNPYKSTSLYEHTLRESNNEKNDFVARNAPVIGPTAFKSTPFYDKNLVVNQFEDKIDNFQNPPMPKNNNYNYNNNDKHDHRHPSTCNCNHEHFDNLLTRMQSTYGQFHNEMSGILEQFKAESNCGSSDSHSSPSQQPNFDYSILCQDTYSLSGDPELAAKCQEFYSPKHDGFYQAPGSKTQIAPQMYKSEFLSYEDYVRMMMGNVNANPNSLLSSSGNMPMIEPRVGSERNDYDETVKSLREYVKDYKEPEVIVSAPIEPEIEVAAPVPEEIQPAKLSIKDRLISLLDELSAKKS